MDLIGYINNREILYLKHNLKVDWVKNLPDSNWLFLGIIEIDNLRIVDEIAGKIIEKIVVVFRFCGLKKEKISIK